MKRSKRRLAILLALILFLFLGIIFYMVKFQLVDAPKLRTDSRNMRNWVDETQFGRGRFYDRNGKEIISREKRADGSYIYYSNHPHMYSHVIGYNSKIYGRTGLQEAYNSQLLNLPEDNAIAALRGSVLNEGVGNDVQLTIDNDLQYTAYTTIEGNRGAAVVLDAHSGAVLAMVSLPSFNVNTLEENWNSIVEDPQDRLFPRASRGLYTPGSVMKPITGAALLESGIALEYEDKGSTSVEGYTYENYQKEAYGLIDLREALMHSSNVYFIDKSRELTASALRSNVDHFGFNRTLPFELTTGKSIADYKEGMSLNLQVSNSFGQGEVLATPLEMASAYAQIANGGTLMRPYVVQNLIAPSGEVTQPTRPQALDQISSKTAETLREDLVATGEAIGLSGRVGQPVGGKTGTAQTASGSTNAWTIGFAPAKNPRIVVCVVLEEDGRTGSEAALPLAAEIMRVALNRFSAAD